MTSQWEAQVIGINYYPPFSGLNSLTAAANDAESVATQLEDYGYETIRVQRLPRKPHPHQKGEWLIDTDEGVVKALELKKAIINLFNPPKPSEPPEMGLLFFSGHGWEQQIKGKKEVFLATSDVYPEAEDYGIALSWLGEQLQTSPVQKIIVWLDCCHSGDLFNHFDKTIFDDLDKDYCLITATRCFESGIEIRHQQGLFTQVLVKGLDPNQKSNPDGIVDSHKLAQYIQRKMAQTGQAPQMACSQRTIPLTINFPKRAFQDECPYRSLSFFTENSHDAQVFYGRTKLIQQLVEKVRRKNRLIAVLGQSGSGKSSLLRAGLLYQLKLGQMLPGSNSWTYLEIITPGDHPVERLRQAFKDRLEQTQENRPIILIIDQFEECFTMCDEAYRQEFIEQLKKLLKFRKNLQIILGMRSDFRSRLREYSQFAAQIVKVNLEHLSAAEIREAIEKPAELVGLGIEDGLKQQLINDVEDYPGSLPLLQYTLTELWTEARAQKEMILRLKTYQKLGGIEATLEKRADKAYASLSEQKKQVAKRIFLELTQRGEAQDTRRRVRLGALVNSHHSYQLLDEVAQTLANRENRLITRTEDSWLKDANNNHPVILEVVHEALIRHWGQLREWQEQYRYGMILERSIEAAAKEWLSKEKNSDYLLQGARLIEAESYLQNYQHWGMLDGLGEEFILESQNLRTQQEKTQQKLKYKKLADLEARRKVEELAKKEAQKRVTAQKKVNKKLLIWSTVAVVFGILAGILGFLSFLNGQEAQLKRQAANLKVKLALSNKVEHLFESIQLVGSNQNFNQSSFTPLTKLIPEIQSVLYQAVEVSRERYVFHGHESAILSIAISSDGKYLVSASLDKTVKLWDVDNQTLVHSFPGHKSSVTSVSFSPDGKYLVSGSADRTIKLWDIENQSLIHSFDNAHEDWILSVNFSPDGQYLVSGSLDKTVKLWDLNNKTLVHSFNAHQEAVFSVAFSPDSNYLVSGSLDKTVKLLDLKNKTLVHSFNAHQEAVFSVSFSPNGQHLVSGSADKTIKLWDVEKQTLIHSFNAHKSWVLSVAFSRDGKYLVSGSLDRKIRLWDGSNQALLHSLNAHGDAVNSVTFSPDGQYLISGSADSKIKFWDRSNQALLKSWDAHESTVYSLALSPDGKYLVSGSADSKLKLWDRANQALIQSWDAHKSAIYSLAFSPDSKYLVSGSADRTIKFWDRSNQVLLESWDAHESTVYSLAFSSDGKYLVSGSADRTIKLWDLYNQSLIHSFQGHQLAVRSLAFSPDGKYLVSGSADNTVKLWDVEDRVLVHSFQGHKSAVNSVDFSPNGKHLASGSVDDTVNLWDVENRVLLYSFQGHESSVYSVAFSPDGKNLVSGSADKTVKLWDVKNKVLLHNFQGHESWVLSVAFSPDGKYLFSGSNDRTVKIWRGIGWKDWLQVGCERIRLHPTLLSGATNSTQAATKTCLKYGNWSDSEKATFNLKKAQSLVQQGKNLAQNIDLKGAQKKFQQAAKLDNQNVNLAELATEANQLAAQALIEKAADVVKQGNVTQALSFYNRAQNIDVNLRIDADSWNLLCWFGGIYRYAGKVLDACERAVELDPDNTAFRDSRGLVRALTGDTQGAIEDFQTYLDSPGGRAKEKRQQWIELLQKGEDPFTDKVLEGLKYE